MNDFMYTPLLLPHSTRLFKIISRDTASGTKCHVFESDLNRPVSPEYTALSYCWGTLPKTSAITLNDRAFRVTENLHAALEVLHASYIDTQFWVDAICIDQSNVREKSKQVLHMRNIYEQANRVVIWLGAGTVGTIKAMDWIETVCRFWDSLVLTHGSDKAILHDICVRRVDEIFNAPTGVIDVAPLHGLIEILTHPWFERVWIIQESTTPKKDMFVHCANAVVRWETLTKATEIVTYLMWRPELQDFFIHAPSIDYQALRRLFNLNEQRQYEKPSMKFLQVLAKYRHFKATDLRDKIYALRGLAADLSDDDVTPDYSLPFHVPFLQAAEFLIVSKRSFECLSFCDYSTRDESQPSWVPSWSSRVVRHPLAKRRVHNSYQDGQPTVYRAAITPTVTCDDKRQWKCTITNGLILRVQGFRVDTIERTAEFEDSEMSSTPSNKIWYEIANPGSGRPAALYGLHIPDSRMYRSSSETLAMAYSRTLVADVAKLGNIRARSYSIDLDHWRHVRHYTHPPVESRYRKQWGSLLFATTGRCLFWSRDGYLGLGPVDTQPGDQVFAFFGGDVFYLLRPVKGGYHFIGECYTHGLMDGEAFSLIDDGSREVQDIIIV